MKILFGLLVSICFCVNSIECQAQVKDTCNSCRAIIAYARASYDQGEFDRAIDMLNKDIIHWRITRQEKIAAYKILILCYLSIDNLELADNSAQKIFNYLDPIFEPDRYSDELRLIDFFKKYVPIPKLAVGVTLGINKPIESTVQQYSVVYPDGNAPASYKTKTGVQIGLTTEKKMWEDLWLNANFTFRSIGYQHILYSVVNENINYSEKLTYIDVPISAKYYFLHHKFQPYIGAGADFIFLTTALSTTFNNEDKDIVNRYPLRKQFQIGYFGCAGAAYTIRHFRLFIEFNYITIPEDVNKTGTRYDDKVNLYKYYYLDDDFRLHNLQMNLGASIILKYKNTQN